MEAVDSLATTCCISSPLSHQRTFPSGYKNCDCQFGPLALIDCVQCEKQFHVRCLKELGKSDLKMKVQDLVKAGKIDEANALVSGGRTHGRNWLVGRKGKISETTPPAPAPSEGYVQELTMKIKQDLEADLEAKVNRKVKENMAWMLKKLGEANPDLKLDVRDFCATASSDYDDNGTPITPCDSE